MAMADYRLCDVCGCKTFYDANLNYDFYPENKDDCVDGDEYTLDYLGDWAVICNSCSKTHKCVIQPKDVSAPPKTARQDKQDN